MLLWYLVTLLTNGRHRIILLGSSGFPSVGENGKQFLFGLSITKDPGEVWEGTLATPYTLLDRL